MGTSTYSEEFKRDAVHQIRVRGYAVREVSGRLGVSTHSLYKWIKLFGALAAQKLSVDHEAENWRLRVAARLWTSETCLSNALAISRWPSCLMQIHLRFDPAAVVISAPLSPERATKTPGCQKDVVTRLGTVRGGLP